MIARPSRGRATSLGIAVCASFLLALTVSGEAEAADPCFAISAPAQVKAAGVTHAQMSPRLGAYCKLLLRTIAQNKPKVDQYYSAGKQRLILRVVRKVADREFGAIATVSAPARASRVTPIAFDFRARLAKFASKALTVVKTVVGGIARVLPQTRLGRCALFAGLEAIHSAQTGADLHDMAINAWWGCFLSLIPPGRTPV
jgi:hypothetical protein